MTKAWAKKLVNEGKRKQIYVIHGDDFHAGFAEADCKDDFFRDGKPSDALKDELEHRLENQGHLLDNTGKTPEQTLDQLAAELERFLLRQNTESAG